MKRATTLVRRPVIAAGDFAFLTVAGGSAHPADWLSGTLPAAFARLERALIRRALAASGGNRAPAAELLGIRRKLLCKKLVRHGMEVSRNGASDVPEADSHAVARFGSG